MLGTGDTAPDFGNIHPLKDHLRNGPVLVTLFKVSCPVCQYTFPFLERLSKSTNIQVVGISQDDAAATEEFRREFGITFPAWIDPAKGYPAGNAFGIESVPSMFLVQPDGKIAMAWSGWSKRDMEELGRIAGVKPFGPGDKVPDWKPG